MNNDQTTVGKATPDASIVVINGCPRSGTSLLNTLLAKRLNAALMPETHFIPLFASYLWLWGGLKTVRQRQRLIQAIFAFTEIRNSRLGVDRIRPYSILVAEPSAASIARDCHTYAEVLEALFEVYRTHHRGALVVEKTAYYAPPSWDLIASSLPSSKFLHVIRDGRDVALSWRKTWFGPNSVAMCAKLWAAHVRRGIEWEKACPERCLRVRYEDLIQNTEDILMQISRYLKVPLLDRAVQQSSIEWLDAISNHDHMRNLDKPIQNMNANRWRKEMDPHEITTFETIAGDALLMAGYGTSLPRQLPLARRNKAMKLAAAYVRRFFSPVEWTRYVLRLLPFALSLSGAIGFSLPTMLRKLRLRG